MYDENGHDFRSEKRIETRKNDRSAEKRSERRKNHSMSVFLSWYRAFLVKRSRTHRVIRAKLQLLAKVSESGVAHGHGLTKLICVADGEN